MVQKFSPLRTTWTLVSSPSPSAEARTGRAATGVDTGDPEAFGSAVAATALEVDFIPAFGIGNSALVPASDGARDADGAGEAASSGAGGGVLRFGIAATEVDGPTGVAGAGVVGASPVGTAGASPTGAAGVSTIGARASTRGAA